RNWPADGSPRSWRGSRKRRLIQRWPTSRSRSTNSSITAIICCRCETSRLTWGERVKTFLRSQASGLGAFSTTDDDPEGLAFASSSSTSWQQSATQGGLQIRRRDRESCQHPKCRISFLVHLRRQAGSDHRRLDAARTFTQ